MSSAGRVVKLAGLIGTAHQRPAGHLLKPHLQRLITPLIEFFRGHIAFDRQMGRDELRELHVQYETPVMVRDIMTPMIFSVGEDTSVQEVAETMVKGRIHRVFVTRDNRLTGIVTALDMMKVIRDL